MSETLLIFVLYALAIFRVVTHFAPNLLQPSWRNQINEIIDSVVQAGVAALFLIHFALRSFWIPSESMVPTLRINDYLIVNELQYLIANPQRGDVAVFHPPAGKSDKTDLIKRVVGIEDDLIEVKDGYLYRNGMKVTEPWLNGPLEVRDGVVFRKGYELNEPDFKGPVEFKDGTLLRKGQKISEPWLKGTVEFKDGYLYCDGTRVAQPWNEGPIESNFPEHRVAKGCCFMMGDNRNNSHDSRYIGDIPLKNFVGRAEVIFFPFARVKSLRLPTVEAVVAEPTPIQLTPPQ